MSIIVTCQYSIHFLKLSHKIQPFEQYKHTNKRRKGVYEMKKIFVLSLSLLFITLSGCMNDKQPTNLEPTRSDPLSLMKLSSKGMTDQQPAMDAKQFLSKEEALSRVRAVNYKDELFIAIEVDNFQRFNLKDIEKDVRKKINNKYKNFNVTVVSDEKLVIELKKLEEQIENNNITNEQLGKRIEELKKLSKEQT